MKKIIVILAAFAAFAFTPSFAQTKVPSLVTESFQSSFTTASATNWSTVADFYCAKFSLNGQEITAYFNDNGELIATGKKADVPQIPIGLQVALSNEYSKYTVTTSLEIDLNGETSYYVLLESAKKKLMLKSTSFGGWETYQNENSFFTNFSE